MSENTSSKKRFSGNRNKNFRHRRNHQNNHFQTNGPKIQRPKAEQLSERDVGITEYISDESGFTGIIKARFSDFHVNEIDNEGKIAKLTDVTVPPNKDCDDKIVTRPPIIPENVWDQIKVLSEKENSDEVISFEVTAFSKDERTTVHQIIKRCYEKNIVANTVDKDGKKFIHFKKYNKFTDKDERGVQWPKNRPQFVHFLLYKESLETMEACYKIADCMRMKVDNFVYAGVKDRRAKTTQWVSVRKVSPEQLIQKTKPMRNIKIGNICFKDQPLKLGRLKGNRFRIALRNVVADDDTINRGMQSLKDKGFINYFGMQRFGNDKQVPTYLIGAKLMQGNFKEVKFVFTGRLNKQDVDVALLMSSNVACELILMLKVSDEPGCDITVAKTVYNQTKDAKKACDQFKRHRNKCLEYKLLEGFSKNGPTDYVNSLENIPRTTRLLYIHAWQSLVWNRIVSRRIKEFGLQPIVGDLVLLDKDHSLAETNAEATERNADVTEDNAETAENDSEAADEDDVLKENVQHVKILCEEDLGNYSIFDVVLPLPGFDIKYPENQIKDWYREILQEYDLELEMPKQKVKTYTLSGKYRKLVEKVSNLSWYTLQYNDPNCNLIRSDWEEFQGEEEPKSIPNGQYKALIIDMCLKRSIYATMVLREILKTDTSTASQTKLNDYHEIKKVEDTANTIGESEHSLLNNPDKFALFKQMVFDDSDDLKRKSEDVDCGGESKKLKTDENNEEVSKQTVTADT